MSKTTTPKLFEPEVFLATIKELAECMDKILADPIEYSFALDYASQNRTNQPNVLETFFDINEKEKRIYIIVNSLLADEYSLKKLKDILVKGLARASNPVFNHIRQREIKAIIDILWSSKWGEPPDAFEETPRDHLMVYDKLMHLETEERAVARIRTRRDFGRKKYGTSMEREDIDELGWLIHAQEEAMDLVIYLERLRAEKLEAQYKDEQN